MSGLMKLHEISELVSLWQVSKKQEELALEERRSYEDKILLLLGVPENFEGTESFKPDTGLGLKIEGRITRKVDSKKLQELANFHGLSDHLPSLFRWKPEINAAVWKATSTEITNHLAEAITAKAGRPSFSIIIPKE
jgi:hypothetical protein